MHRGSFDGTALAAAASPYTLSAACVLILDWSRRRDPLLARCTDNLSQAAIDAAAGSPADDGTKLANAFGFGAAAAASKPIADGAGKPLAREGSAVSAPVLRGFGVEDNALPLAAGGAASAKSATAKAEPQAGAGASANAEALPKVVRRRLLAPLLANIYYTARLWDVFPVIKQQATPPEVDIMITLKAMQRFGLFDERGRPHVTLAARFASAAARPHATFTAEVAAPLAQTSGVRPLTLGQ